MKSDFFYFLLKSRAEKSFSDIGGSRTLEREEGG